jgi:hypothetical protein
MNTNVRVKGKVRVYSVGGCGVNIGSLLEKHRGQSEAAFAEVDIVYVDTSKSNLRAHIDQSHCFMIEGLDGSGKLRSENHEEINDRVRSILQMFKPTDLNIVVGSAAGGSGSVIGPLLTRELLASEAPTIVLTIGSTDTKLDAENTLKTIKSYEAISKMAGAPVVMAYVQNGQVTSRSEADSIMFNTIMALTVLFSRENLELDSKDLFNWLRFNRVTTFPVQLASLSIIENQSGIKEVGNIISVATLAKDGVATSMAEMPEYQCVGFLSSTAATPVVDRMPLHYVISDGILPEVVKNINKLLSTLESAQLARTRKVSIVTEKDNATDSGLIL